jgi:hypothetical protein
LLTLTISQFANFPHKNPNTHRDHQTSNENSQFNNGRNVCKIFSKRFSHHPAERWWKTEEKNSGQKHFAN